MPLKLFYRNKAGMEFILRDVTDESTQINYKGSSIVVNHSIHRISSAWDDWLKEVVSIHTMMNFLEDWEREFIVTGLTKDEQTKLWDRFKY